MGLKNGIKKCFLNSLKDCEGIGYYFFIYLFFVLIYFLLFNAEIPTDVLIVISTISILMYIGKNNLVMVSIKEISKKSRKE